MLALLLTRAPADLGRDEEGADEGADEGAAVCSGSRITLVVAVVGRRLVIPPTLPSESSLYASFILLYHSPLCPFETGSKHVMLRSKAVAASERAVFMAPHEVRPEGKSPPPALARWLAMCIPCGGIFYLARL